ncbi:MAG: hypothetical protein ACREM8_04710, partial [Vulcanimicrobiaceae bacterium]
MVSSVALRRPDTIGATLMFLLSIALAAAAIGFGLGGDWKVVGAVMFAGIALWSTVKWEFGIYLLLAVASVDGFIKLMDVSRGTYVIKDVILLAVIFGMLLTLRRERAAEVGFPRGVKMHGLLPWIAYFVYIAVEVFNPEEPILYGLAGAHARIFFMLLFFVGAMYFRTGRRVAGVANFVVGGIAFASAVGIVQFIAPEQWAKLSPGHAHNIHYWRYADVGSSIMNIPRVYGTLVDPGTLGLACAYGLVLASVGFTRARTLQQRIWV